MSGEWKTPSCCETYSGLYVDFADPKPEQIVLEDVARGLAAQVRFCGHIKMWHSLAQHSCFTASLFDKPWEQGLALFHDAHESYMSDLARALKKLISSKIEKSALESALSLVLPSLRMTEADMDTFHGLVLAASAPTYEEVAERLQNAIEVALLPDEWLKWRDSPGNDFRSRLVAADNAACRCEAKELKASGGLEWNWGDTPIVEFSQRCWNADESERQFLLAARRLLTDPAMP